MFVIGCDFGLVKSGLVVMAEDFSILCQTLLRVRSKGAQRLVDIEAGFEQIIGPYKENIEVFVEGYAYGAKYQRESLAELGGVMRRYFCVNKLNYWVIPPTSNKQFVTGTGKASKNYMKKITREKWDLNFKSDDVCDAHGLARLGTTVKLVEAGLDPRWAAPLADHETTVVGEILDNKEHYLNGNTARRRRRNDKQTKTKG